MDKYLESAGEGVARAITSMSGRGTLPSATGGERSAPSPDGTVERPFEVYAEFELTVTTSLPTTAFAVGLAADVPVAVTLPDGASATLGLNPMRAGGLGSRLVLRLERFDQDDAEWRDDAEDLAQLGANLTGAAQRPEGSRIGRGSFPIGVWGPPDPEDQEKPALPAGDVLTTGNQVTLVAEAELGDPGPEVNYYKVDIGDGRRPLPLSAEMDPRDALLTAAAPFEQPLPATVAAAMLEAERVLFATPPTLVSGGPQANGRRSELDRASYAGRLAAPPMFGTLADGLAAANADPVLREEIDPPAEPTPRTPQDPRVVGFLASGADVTARRPGTTVSDARLPRRPAPSSPSVLARLGRHLPAQLDVSVPPGARTGGTVTPAAIPRTGASGALRSYRIGTGPAATAVAGLAGARTAASATPLRPGDVVVLQAPDHAIDTDVAASRRPRLVVDGAAARVTTVRGDGVVLADRVQAGAAVVEPGAALVVVQAGGAVVPDEGVAGWHSRGHVVSVGTGTALGAGCVLTLDNLAAAPGVSWSPAGDTVRGADTVLTSFGGFGAGRPARCVVLVVESADPEHVESMGLSLLGAVRSRDADGAPREPVLVVNGNQVAAVYPVEPGAAGTAGWPRRRSRARPRSRCAWRPGRPGSSPASWPPRSPPTRPLPGSAATGSRPRRRDSWRRREAAGPIPNGTTGCTISWRRGRKR